MSACGLPVLEVWRPGSGSGLRAPLRPQTLSQSTLKRLGGALRVSVVSRAKRRLGFVSGSAAPTYGSSPGAVARLARLMHPRVLAWTTVGTTAAGLKAQPAPTHGVPLSPLPGSRLARPDLYP
eukprot:358020-Chlamydomonas_euryale.AAC.18